MINNGSTISSEVSNQNDYLQSYGLHRRLVNGDGNCLFRVISVGLFDDEGQFAELRHLAVIYIKEHRTEFMENFIPDSNIENGRRILNCSVCLKMVFMLDLNVLKL